jgi:hypothetical protein
MDIDRRFLTVWRLLRQMIVRVEVELITSLPQRRAHSFHFKIAFHFASDQFLLKRGPSQAMTRDNFNSTFRLSAASFVSNVSR